MWIWKPFTWGQSQGQFLRHLSQVLLLAGQHAPKTLLSLCPQYGDYKQVPLGPSCDMYFGDGTQVLTVACKHFSGWAISLAHGFAVFLQTVFLQVFIIYIWLFRFIIYALHIQIPILWLPFFSHYARPLSALHTLPLSETPNMSSFLLVSSDKGTE